MALRLPLLTGTMVAKRIHPKSDELKAKLTEARRKAWITRRKKYGRKGHAGSYRR